MLKKVDNAKPIKDFLGAKPPKTIDGNTFTDFILNVCSLNSNLLALQRGNTFTFILKRLFIKFHTPCPLNK